MSCCAEPRADVGPMLRPAPAAAMGQVTFSLGGLHCAGCIGAIERAVAALPGDVAARVNFTRATVTLDGACDPEIRAAVGAIRNLGYAVRPLADAPAPDAEGRALLLALGVAGFGAMNVMLLSVAVWAGADGATRQVLNWFAALIALPTLVFAARPFARSAVAALAARRLNMDVPITLAIVLAAGLSLAETIAGEGETYFDAAVTLTFFLLAGRLAAHHTSERARRTLSRLAALQPRDVVCLLPDRRERIPVGQVTPGIVFEVAAGERVPLDARLIGAGRFDAALVTGESEPVRREPGEEIGAGVLALDGPVRLVALRPAADSLLARLSELQRAAEAARPPLTRIADRAAAIYAPVVHLAAFAAFVGWWAAGTDPATALTIAIAVLIVTCPCALGLAVPMVQAAASEVMFRAGLVVKDGAALERLRTVDSVVFDKTGTLTAVAVDPAAVLPDGMLAEAATLARHSSHPIARALAREASARGLALPDACDVAEHPGAGVSARLDGRRAFLGQGTPPWDGPASEGPALHRERHDPFPLAFVASLRPDAVRLVARLRDAGLNVAIVSGDRAVNVRPIAGSLAVSDWHAGCSSSGKVGALVARRDAGESVLMVGDGLNDGPALAAATASVAVADATDLARAAADVVMVTDRLERIADAVAIARRAHRLTLQNLVFCALYNAAAIPLAVAGFASPLAAAVMMSGSSLVVVANAARLRRTTGSGPA